MQLLRHNSFGPVSEHRGGRIPEQAWRRDALWRWMNTIAVADIELASHSRPADVSRKNVAVDLETEPDADIHDADSFGVKDDWIGRGDGAHIPEDRGEYVDSDGLAEKIDVFRWAVWVSVPEGEERRSLQNECVGMLRASSNSSSHLGQKANRDYDSPPRLPRIARATGASVNAAPQP